jgi:hypothetical protein
MRRRHAAAAVALIVAAVSCGTAAKPVAGTGAPATVTLAAAGAANMGVNLAASGERVVAVWAAIAADVTNVYAAVSGDGGVTFGAPVRVNDVDGDARWTGEQAPRVWMGAAIDVAWESKLGGSSRIRLSRSMDGGRSFQPAETLHAEALPGARGWASLAGDARGMLQAAWLDGRNADHADHAHAPGAAHMAMEQDLFHVTIAADGARTEALVAKNACFCCKTSVATGPDGAMYVAWRNIYPVNIRDIAVAHSADGGRTWSAPVRVSEDHWTIDACPEDGPSIAVDAANVLHIVWPTLVDDGRKAVFASESTDGGKTFAPRVRVDAAAADVMGSSHPQLTVAGADAVAVWDETLAHGRRVMMRDLNSPQAPPVIVTADGDPSYPAVTSSDAARIVAWTGAWTAHVGGGSVIRVARVAK